MADNKVRLPSSGGGLVRYYDDFKAKIEIPPMWVVIIIAFVIILETYLYKMPK